MCPTSSVRCQYRTPATTFELEGLVRRHNIELPIAETSNAGPVFRQHRNELPDLYYINGGKIELPGISLSTRPWAVGCGWRGVPGG